MSVDNIIGCCAPAEASEITPGGHDNRVGRRVGLNVCFLNFSNGLGQESQDAQVDIIWLNK